MTGIENNSGYLQKMSGEEGEVNLSALIDGELEPQALLETIDHLVSDKESRDFYRQARQLQQRYGAGTFSISDEKLSGDIWSNIEAKVTEKVKHTPKTETRFFSLSSPIWAAAAAVILIFGLWASGTLKFPLPIRQKGPIVVKLEEDEGKMDEGRFVELTAELLRADRRYHRKMMDLLESLNPRAIVQEGDLETYNSNLASLNENSGREPDRLNTQRTPRDNRAGLIDIKLW